MSRNSSQSISYINRKIAVMGAPYVGKSAVAIRFVEGVFRENYESTIEDLLTKRIEFNNKHYLLKVTDTAGQEEYSVFPRSCSFDINGFILVYAIDNRKSFERVTNIYDKIVDVYRDTSIPLLIVGNKNDLEDRCVLKTEGQELAESWGAQFIEISARNINEVIHVFDLILREIEISRGNLIRPCSPKPPPTIHVQHQHQPQQLHQTIHQSQQDKDSCTIS